MMRCREIQEALDEFNGIEATVFLREHLDRCRSCRSYAESRRLVRAGFKALAEEPVPEASVGFAARLVRSLEETVGRVDPAREFLERAGRRAVYASLVLAMTVLLGLLVPSWSPLRGSSTLELSPAPQLQAAESDPIFADDASLNSQPPPGNRKDLAPGQGPKN